MKTSKETSQVQFQRLVDEEWVTWFAPEPECQLPTQCLNYWMHLVYEVGVIPGPWNTENQRIVGLERRPQQWPPLDAMFPMDKVDCPQYIEACNAWEGTQTNG